MYSCLGILKTATKVTGKLNMAIMYLRGIGKMNPIFLSFRLVLNGCTMRLALRKQFVLIFFLLSCLSGNASSSELTFIETAAVRETLNKIAPKMGEAIITRTPIKGLYQVQLGMTVVYLSVDGKFLVRGEVIDLVSGDNLADQTLNEARKRAMASIPESSMIIYPAEGEQKHFITVFSDIDCPYCTKLHREIPVLNKAGISVRYLAFPRAGINSPSYRKAVSVWCAENPVMAMNEAMQGIRIPEKTCQNPVKDHLTQVEIFEVNGTPNIILDSGKLLPGYVPSDELIKAFK